MRRELVSTDEASIRSTAAAAVEPFPESRLDSLLAVAARDAPRHVLIRDDEGQSSAAALAERVERLASLLTLASLRPRERILVVGGARADAFVALVAALRAGLEPVLANAGLGPIELAACARAASASALIGPARYGDLDLAETYLSAAVLADTIRLVATQGPGEVDGALDVSSARLDAMNDLPPAPADSSTETTIGTFQGHPSAPVLVTHRQAALFADALSLVEQAHVNPSKPIVSTLPPTTAAGLVAGPFAALIGAAGLILHGPFDATRFLSACDDPRGYHLVVPASVGDVFEAEALAAGMATLILVSRFPAASAFALPAPSRSLRPIVDVYAFGEETLLAQRRTDGQARPPARVTDKSVGGGLGARLNRARADHPASDDSR